MCHILLREHVKADVYKKSWYLLHEYFYVYTQFIHIYTPEDRQLWIMCSNIYYKIGKTTT